MEQEKHTDVEVCGNRTTRKQRCTRRLISFILGGLRLWQWTTAFFVGAGFRFYHRPEHNAGNMVDFEQVGRVLQNLGLVILIYCTLVITCVHIFRRLGLSSWRVFAVISVPCDLAMMGIYLAKISILSVGLASTDAPIQQPGDDRLAGDLVRQSLRAMGVGPGSVEGVRIFADPKVRCDLLSMAFGLSIIGIFSYTFTVLFTVLYLQQHPREAESFDPEKDALMQGEETSPWPSVDFTVGSDSDSEFSLQTPSRSRSSTLSGTSRPVSSHSNATSHYFTRTSTGSRPTSHLALSNRHSFQSQHSTRTASTWGATTLASSHRGDTGSSRSSVDLDDSAYYSNSGASRHTPSEDGVRPETPRPRRWSTSTSSSYNVNAFLVADGFRPSERMAEHVEGASSAYVEPVKGG